MAKGEGKEESKDEKIRKQGRERVWREGGRVIKGNRSEIDGLDR